MELGGTNIVQQLIVHEIKALAFCPAYCRNLLHVTPGYRRGYFFAITY